MSLVPLGVRAHLYCATDSADFKLLVMVDEPDGRTGATIADMPIDDPNLQQRLRDVCQAYRMGARFGKAV